MPRLWRSVSHQSQRSQADCLPVAAQMVIAYLGLSTSYEVLHALLGTQSYGTTFRRLEQLSKLGLTVAIDHLAIEEIASYIKQDLPVIAGIHTAALPYWTQAVDHAVVVAGIDSDRVHFHDPTQANGPQIVTRVAFELAQLDFDNLCAVIAQK